MDLGLADKRAWVIGASSGLGLASAISLAAEGSRLALSSRSPGRLEAAAAQIGGSPPPATVPLDLTDTAGIATACEEVVTKLGGLDVVVLSPGGPPGGGFADADDDALQHAFDLLLRSTFAVAKTCLPHLRECGGVLVCVTSSSTKELLPNLFLSNVLRLGVLGLTKSIAREVAADGVRVVCVAPGRIATDRVASIDAAAAGRTGRSVAEVRESSEADIPVGRYGDPSEFGDAVAFLASPRASYITGTTVVVDGGKVRAVAS
jgi:3-oxoacyl-[acyl-carrier protein] reductase